MTLRIDSGFRKALKARLERGLSEAGDVYLEAVEGKLSGTTGRTGRTYRKNIGGRVIRHVASAPGEPPAELSGELVRKLASRDARGDDPAMQFGSNAPHAKAVTELRPEFWGDALKEARPAIQRAFVDGFEGGA